MRQPVAIQNLCEQAFRKVFQRVLPESVESGAAQVDATAATMSRDSLQLTVNAKGAAKQPATAAQASSAYRAANQKVSGKYPTLDVVLKDPDAYIADLKSRFAAQKALDPAHPYQFDFSDYGVPVLKQWSGLLRHETTKVAGQIARHRTLSLSASALAERQGTLEHLGDLQREVDGHVQSGHIDYQRMQELAYFTSRAMGRFDTSEVLSLKDRLLLKIDRSLEGHQDTPIAEERARYKADQTGVFEAKSLDPGFQTTEGAYKKGFTNPQSLDMIVLPTSEALGTDVFRRLSGYDIFLEGVTSDPIAADGFVRPSSDFMVHDMRHNSAIYYWHDKYAADHQLSAGQVDQLRKQEDVWRQQLDSAENAIDDPQLKAAVKMLDFNYHHDRGFPMLPSSFQNPTLDHATIPYLLHRMLKISGQIDSNAYEGSLPHFDAPYHTIEKAYAWLRAFWLPRSPQEQAIVAAKSSVDAASQATRATRATLPRSRRPLVA